MGGLPQHAKDSYEQKQEKDLIRFSQSTQMYLKNMVQRAEERLSSH